MQNLIALALLFVVGAILYRSRDAILRRLERFDARNAARAADERRERHDRFAHYRHAVRLAEETTEAVAPVRSKDERTGTPLTRYRFLGGIYATRNEADAARREHALQKARSFYEELDREQLGRAPAQARQPPEGALSAPADPTDSQEP